MLFQLQVNSVLNFLIRELNFAIFLQSRKTRNLRPTKLSTSKVSVFSPLFLKRDGEKNALLTARKNIEEYREPMISS